MSITKLHSRKLTKDIDYTTTDYLVEELIMYSTQMGWSILDMLETLLSNKADTFSITKEKPFSYLYARMRKSGVLIRLQTSDQDIEFEIPLHKLKEV